MANNIFGLSGSGTVAATLMEQNELKKLSAKESVRGGGAPGRGGPGQDAAAAGPNPSGIGPDPDKAHTVTPSPGSSSRSAAVARREVVGMVQEKGIGSGRDAGDGAECERRGGVS